MSESIVYFNELDISLPGGPNVNEYEFVRALDRHFGARLSGLIPIPREPLHGFDSAPIEFYRQPRIGLSLWYWLYSAAVAWRLRRMRLRSRAPLIVARMGHMPVTLWVASTVLREPIALKSVGSYWLARPNASPRDRLWHWVSRKLCNSVVRRCCMVDAVTPQLAARLVEQTGRTSGIHVVPNATALDRFRPLQGPRHFGSLDLDRARPVLGYVGTHPSTRGARQLVELAARLAPRWPNLVVVVAGWDVDLSAVEELARAMGVAERCHFLGVIPYEQVPAFIHLLDVGFSMDDPIRASILGNSSQKVRQYLACGCPVISMPVGGEFLETNALGRVADPGDPDAILGATEDLLHELERDRDGITARIRSYAESHLSIEKTLQQRIAIWSAAVEPQPLEHPDS